MTLRDRIGFDAGARKLEEAVRWAAEHEIYYIDFNADAGPNHVETWTSERVAGVRAACDRGGIHLGLHTLSGVNVAEFSPYAARGVDEYLRANADLAASLRCEWMVVHAGYHFSATVEERVAASLSRLERLAHHVSNTGLRLLLENMNREPGRAEVHYLAHDIDECRRYFDAPRLERLGWAFTVNHANLLPEGIDGFLDAFGIDRISEVRLADNSGEYEVHLAPGEGNIDFRSLIGRLEGAGYVGHYSMAFGSDDEKLAARDLLASYGRNDGP